MLCWTHSFIWSLGLPSSFTEHKCSNNMVRSPTLLINKSLILVETSDNFLLIDRIWVELYRDNHTIVWLVLWWSQRIAFSVFPVFVATNAQSFFAFEEAHTEQFFLCQLKYSFWSFIYQVIWFQVFKSYLKFHILHKGFLQLIRKVKIFLSWHG